MVRTPIYRELFYSQRNAPRWHLGIVSTMRIVFLTTLFCAVAASPQSVASVDRANRLGEDAMRHTNEQETFAVSTFNGFQYFADPVAISAKGTRDPQMSSFGESLAPGSSAGSAAHSGTRGGL